MYEYMFDETRFTAAAADIERVIKLTGVSYGAALDMGCGAGRHTIALARKGFRVTGVDQSQFLLEKASEKSTGILVEYVHADMREFSRPGAFDLAVSMYTSFGYFDTREEDSAVLRNLRASLRPGGVVVMDLSSAESIALLTSRTWWVDRPNGEILVLHSEPAADWSRLDNHWLIVNGERVRRFDFDFHLYTARELRAAMEQAGFSSIRMFGSLAGTPYDATATRLVAVAKAH
jgi:SAM-dependent methyltransferase